MTDIPKRRACQPSLSALELIPAYWRGRASIRKVEAERWQQTAPQEAHRHLRIANDLDSTADKLARPS